MKFSKQLQYNAVAEWRPHYMDYGQLKKLITQLRKLKEIEWALLHPNSTENNANLGGNSSTSQNEIENVTSVPDAQGGTRQKNAKLVEVSRVSERVNSENVDTGGYSDAERDDENREYSTSSHEDKEQDEDDELANSEARKIRKKTKRREKKTGELKGSSKDATLRPVLRASASQSVLANFEQQQQQQPPKHTRLIEDGVAVATLSTERESLLKSESEANYSAIDTENSRGVVVDLGQDQKNVAQSLAKVRHDFNVADAAFFRRLRSELHKVNSFYVQMEAALSQITHELQMDARRCMDLDESNDGLEHHDEFGGDRGERALLRNALRRRYVEHYLEITEVQTFAELNATGVDKILKKHDKNTELNTREAFTKGEEFRKLAFVGSERLNSQRVTTEREFANLFWRGDISRAKDELMQSLRDMVIWERNTIWRDMLLSERRVRSVRTKKASPGSGLVSTSSIKVIPLSISFVAFVVVWMLSPRLLALLTSVSSGDSDESFGNTAAAERSLALLTAAILLWATEAVPLYVTSFAIAPTAVLLRVFVDEKTGLPLDAAAAAKHAVSSSSTTVLLLIIGGYSISAALSKYALDRMMATAVLSRVRSPRQMLLVVMLLAVLLSMWVSNVAAPVLLNSVVMTILRGLPSSARPLVKCVLLGVAIASNLGGMGSPIASPQNAVALGQLSDLHPIGFLEWMCIAVPLCLFLVVCAHAFLVWIFKPQRFALPIIPKHSDPFTSAHWGIVLTLALTIFLWCFKPAMKVFGSEGVVAAFPVIIYFGCGILTKEDFNNLPWNVIYLVSGGICLGSAVQSSHLLSILASALHAWLEDASLWIVFTVFILFIFIVSSAISHTVSAIILLPVVAELGASLGHPRLLVMGGAFACSTAMALPVSSFPNMAAVSVESEFGKPYIDASDIIKMGIPLTILSAVIMITLGFILMISIGF